MKHTLFILFFVLLTPVLHAQTTVEVEGTGSNRSQAMSDAYRRAAETAGTQVYGTTQMQNFITLNDYVATRTDAYVTLNSVLDESERNGVYRVKISATVSQSLTDDIKSFDQMVGGVKYICWYDPKDLSDEEKMYGEYATERVNQLLTEKGYAVEDITLMKDPDQVCSETTYPDLEYLYQVGLYTQSDMMIQIKKLNILLEKKKVPGAGELTQASVTIEIKCLDVSRMDVLASVELKSEPMLMPIEENAVKAAIENALTNEFDKMMNTYHAYIKDWALNGVPYDVRFYTDSLTFKFFELNKFKNALTQQPDLFGGTMRVNLISGKYGVCEDVKLKSAQFNAAEHIMNAVMTIDAWGEFDLRTYSRVIICAPYYEIDLLPQVQQRQTLLSKRGGQ